MNTFSLALRNLLRNRRRSLTTLLAMVVGLVAILLFGGYRSNIMSGMETGFVQYGGHLQVQRKGYFVDGGDNPTAYGIDNYEPLVERIRNDSVLGPMVAVVTPTLQLGGIAGNFASGTSRSVMATGLLPEDRNRMVAWNDYRIVSYAEPLPLAGAGEDAVVVGTGVARKLGLCALIAGADCAARAPARGEADGPALPDDIAALSAQESQRDAAPQANRIEMLAATAHGAPNVAGLHAIKASNMGIKALDDVYMAMHLKQAQRLIYGQSAPQVTSIIVQLRHTAQMPQAQARLAALLKEVQGQELEIVDFDTLNQMYVQTRQFMDSMFSFIAILIGVIVLFTIGNTMSTAVMERTVEIGTLRAIGQRRAGIRRLFLCEAAILGTAGSAIGVLCALLVANAINHSGWTWTPPGYSTAYLVLVRVADNLPLLAGCVAGMMAVTMLSAWWPARRAATSVIVDALRHA